MIEINNLTRQKINLSFVKKIAKKFLKERNKSKCGLSIAFVKEKEMHRLNRTYRRENKATDILSFGGEGNFLGELIINYVQIKKQARDFGKNVDEELAFVATHGLLHLLGYKDDTKKGKKEMIELGEKFLKSISKRKTKI